MWFKICSSTAAVQPDSELHLTLFTHLNCIDVFNWNPSTLPARMKTSMGRTYTQVAGYFSICYEYFMKCDIVYLRYSPLQDKAANISKEE